MRPEVRQPLKATPGASLAEVEGRLNRTTACTRRLSAERLGPPDPFALHGSTWSLANGLRPGQAKQSVPHFQLSMRGSPVGQSHPVTRRNEGVPRHPRRPSMHGLPHGAQVRARHGTEATPHSFELWCQALFESRSWFVHSVRCGDTTWHQRPRRENNFASSLKQNPAVLSRVPQQHHLYQISPTRRT